MKQQIDAELIVSEEILEVIDVARSFLIDREFRLVNARKNAMEAVKFNRNSFSTNQASPQLTPSSSYDPFKRSDSKRKSITTSFSNMFRRPSLAGNFIYVYFIFSSRHCEPVFFWLIHNCVYYILLTITLSQLIF